jgi:hypothetical protein
MQVGCGEEEKQQDTGSIEVMTRIDKFMGGKHG